MNKIKKGDLVEVIAGKDKGKRGTVLSLVDKGERLIVDGVNVAKKHVKGDPQKGLEGGIVAKPMSIHCSNVMHVDPNTQKRSRVGIRVLADKQRVRFYKASDQVIEVNK